MAKASDGQYELVLENRQVLTIFFAVVVLCGVFFGLGYTVGKNTVGYIPPADGSVVAAAGKKSAISPQPVNVADTHKEELAAAPATSNVTYDKSLEKKASSARLETQAASGGLPAAAAPAETKPAAAEAKPTAEGAITLQVAALSKKDDADALLGLLSKKGFRAYTTTGQDRLYRVQIGPFSKPKDAEDAKAQLAQEGFKVITKK